MQYSFNTAKNGLKINELQKSRGSKRRKPWQTTGRRGVAAQGRAAGFLLITMPLQAWLTDRKRKVSPCSCCRAKVPQKWFHYDQWSVPSSFPFPARTMNLCAPSEWKKSYIAVCGCVIFVLCQNICKNILKNNASMINWSCLLKSHGFTVDFASWLKTWLTAEGTYQRVWPFLSVFTGRCWSRCSVATVVPTNPRKPHTSCQSCCSFLRERLASATRDASQTLWHKTKTGLIVDVSGNQTQASKSTELKQKDDSLENNI